MIIRICHQSLFHIQLPFPQLQPHILQTHQPAVQPFNYHLDHAITIQGSMHRLRSARIFFGGVYGSRLYMPLGVQTYIANSGDRCVKSELDC